MYSGKSREKTISRQAFNTSRRNHERAEGTARSTKSTGTRAHACRLGRYPLTNRRIRPRCLEAQVESGAWLVLREGHGFHTFMVTSTPFHALGRFHGAACPLCMAILLPRRSTLVSCTMYACLPRALGLRRHRTTLTPRVHMIDDAALFVVWSCGCRGRAPCCHRLAKTQSLGGCSP